MRRTCIHYFILTLCLTATAACYEAPASDPIDADTSGATDADDSADATDPTNATLTSSTTDPTTDDSADDSESSGAPDPTDATDPTDPTDPSEGESSEGDGDTTGAPAVPAIVETVPADGATGVRSDVAIVVRFDTAMDQAATQAAYQSMSLPAAWVTFAWNEDGDELTITPLAPLPYAEGDDPISLGAHAFAFTITTTATSLDGVAIDDDVSVVFTTLRRIEQVVERDTDMSGNVGDNAGPLGASFIGDRPNNEPVRYAVTFGLDALAAEIVEIEDATFRASWTSQSGDPWGDLGGGTVFQHVVYADLDDAFDAPATGTAHGLFGGVADTDVERDAAWALETALADLEAHDDRLQLRIRWFIETDNDGAYDTVTLNPANLELRATYLAH